MGVVGSPMRVVDSVCCEDSRGATLVTRAKAFTPWRTRTRQGRKGRCAGEAVHEHVLAAGESFFSFTGWHSLFLLPITPNVCHVIDCAQPLLSPSFLFSPIPACVTPSPPALPRTVGVGCSLMRCEFIAQHEHPTANSRPCPPSTP